MSFKSTVNRIAKIIWLYLKTAKKNWMYVVGSFLIAGAWYIQNFMVVDLREKSDRYNHYLEEYQRFTTTIAADQFYYTSLMENTTRFPMKTLMNISTAELNWLCDVYNLNYYGELLTQNSSEIDRLNKELIHNIDYAASVESPGDHEALDTLLDVQKQISDSLQRFAQLRGFDIKDINDIGAKGGTLITLCFLAAGTILINIAKITEIIKRTKTSEITKSQNALDEIAPLKDQTQKPTSTKPKTKNKK